MRKIFLLLTLFASSCSDSEDEDTSIFIGKWNLIEMGQYEVSSTCSGNVDDTEWRGLKGKGLTVVLDIKKDGTGTETRTGINPMITSFTWYDVADLFCYDNKCTPYEMAPNNLSYRVNRKTDSFCLDEDFQTTIHDSRRSCIDASSSNQWNDAICKMERYRKEI